MYGLSFTRLAGMMNDCPWAAWNGGFTLQCFSYTMDCRRVSRDGGGGKFLTLPAINDHLRRMGRVHPTR
jgi:hypothetical protein